jgi:hypothetical protein
MFLEFTVATVCIAGNGSGCSEATSAYYKQNVQLQRVVQNVESFGKEIVENNQWIVYAATPMYATLSGQPARFHVYKGVVLGVNVRNNSAFVQWTY